MSEKRKTTETRRKVMRSFGEYVDFVIWLQNAKSGADVSPDDPPIHTLAEWVNRANHRYQDALKTLIQQMQDAKP